MASKEELEELASQLRKPNGEKGLDIAHMMNETNSKMTIHSIETLNIEAENSILELGHGNCGHLSFLLSQNRNLKYTGLEISELMHHEAKRINQQFEETHQASFHLYQGKDIPFNTNTFDRIFSVNTIYFWTDPAATLAEMSRVLKADGIINITFAQSSFMKQLPFTQFHFELYDTEKAKKLISQTDLKWLNSSNQSETIKSKTGDMVVRDFTTISLTK